MLLDIFKHLVAYNKLLSRFRFLVLLPSNTFICSINIKLVFFHMSSDLKNKKIFSLLNIIKNK